MLPSKLFSPLAGQKVLGLLRSESEIVSQVKRKTMRICFLLKVRPEKLEEYKARHERVWPEMQNALRESGWRNYSLFLRPDGLVVGYLEADDFEKCSAKMNHHPVNTRWQAEMAPLFEPSNGAAANGTLFPLEEVFHLD
jgi:L-rhamnose mutarotase